MEQKKAVVLLSTYNGEKYISQQIDSLLAQSYKNLEIVVRDDGSSDRTVEILEKYASEHGNIRLVKDGLNLRYPGCFYKLTDMDSDGDFFFFCDQDDVWKPNKIERAVSIMEKEDTNTILAYYAGYHVCDSQLTPLYDVFPPANVSFTNTIYEIPGLEFAMAINKTAKEYLTSHKPVKAAARGTWMSIMFTARGKILTDPWASAYYRRHETTVTLSKQGFIAQQKWRYDKFILYRGLDNYQNMLREFLFRCGHELSDHDRKTLQLFSNKKYFPYAFRKTFYPTRLRRKWADELLLRALFLIGKA